jgi:acetyl esterase/lipase
MAIKFKTFPFERKKMNKRVFLVIPIATLLFSACGLAQPSTPTPDPALVMTQAFATVNASFTQTALAAPTATPTATPYPTVLAAPPTTGMVLKDVTYCTNDIPLKMDIYFPDAGSGPWPALLYFHGGIWMLGDKDKAIGLRDIPALRAAGYLVANVEYRQAPEYPFPAMIIDAKCAVRFLRGHASELNIDPNHIGTWGSSSGGHLVSLLAMADKSVGWDTGEYLEESSNIQAVVDMFGPTDLADPAYTTRMEKIGYFVLFGVKEPSIELLKSASPISYVSPNAPPFLIIQGEKDKIVDMQQSQKLNQSLQSAGVATVLIVVSNAGHNFEAVDGAISPTRDEITQYMVSFFDALLKPVP